MGWQYLLCTHHWLMVLRKSHHIWRNFKLLFLTWGILWMLISVMAVVQPAIYRLCLLLLISMLWHRQAIFESKADKLSSSAECRIRTQRVSGTESPADWMPADKPTELSRIKLKTWTRQPVPMISEHSAHSTPLPFGIRTWLWRYTCLLLLMMIQELLVRA